MAKLSEENGQVTIKINVDTSDAVNSIKKLQRVARESVRQLKEVESLSRSISYDKEMHLKKALDLLPGEIDKKEGSMVHTILKATIYSLYEDDLKPSGKSPLINDIESFSTKELTDELAKREGIRNFTVEPYGKLAIFVDNGKDGDREMFTGPAIVLVNQD
jgi:hypothetical protein